MRRPSPPLNAADAVDFPRLTVFIPNNGDRPTLATVLVAAADEAGLGQNHIQASTTGFLISDDLADIIYDEPVEEEPEPDPEPPKTPAKAPAKTGSKKKTSGNRAEKK